MNSAKSRHWSESRSASLNNYSRRGMVRGSLNLAAVSARKAIDNLPSLLLAHRILKMFSIFKNFSLYWGLNMYR